MQDEFVDVATERALIAALAENPELLWRLDGLVSESAFWECAEAWQGITQAIRNGHQPPKFEGWAAANNPLASAQHLTHLRCRRIVAKTLEEVAEHLYAKETSAHTLFAQLEESLARARSAVATSKAGRVLPATEVLVNVMAAAEGREIERKRTGKPVMGLLTEIRRLDDLLGGLNEGLYILGGPPAMGKTTFALQVSNVVAKDTPVIYVTFENSAENLTLKAVCGRAGINTQEVRRGLADMPHLEAVATEWIQDVATRLAFIEGTLGLSVSDVRARALEAMNRYKVGRCLIVVDYLQLWGKGAIAYRGLETARSRVETLGAELRELAMSLKSPVLVLSSQNRQMGNYGDGTGRTSLDSLKESGDLEYMCDAALFLVGSKERTTTHPARALELDVRKNRDGDTGQVHLIFRPDISHFREEETNV